MFILVSSILPPEGLVKLQEYGKVQLFSTSDIVYESISCHPDIFICNYGNTAVVAPELPDVYFYSLQKAGLDVYRGQCHLSGTYPGTAVYNAVVSRDSFIHNFKYTDPVVLEIFPGIEKIHVNQGYTRCNLIRVDDRTFITSDRGIFRTMTSKGFNVYFINPSGISLPGEKCGFIGGCCGIYRNQIFFAGSLDCIEQGPVLRNLLIDFQFEVIELFDGWLLDVGGILLI